nr:Protein F56D5.6, isoform b [Haemonchus contortus]
MHAATLFLCSLIAGVISIPTYRASRRLRRDDPLVGTSRLLSQDNEELPPLPLEFEEEIYMSIDDPRVGSVDEEGNVLVPVDEEGRILPGFEHLVSPHKSSDLNVQPTGEDEARVSATEAEAAVSKSDDIEASYDENAIDTSAALLPTASDYVDSREADSERNSGRETVGVAAKPDLSGLEEVFQAENNVEDAKEKGQKADDKIDQIVNEMFELARDKEFDQDLTLEDKDREEGTRISGPGVLKMDEELPEDGKAEVRPAADPQGNSDEDDALPEIGLGLGAEVARVLPVGDDEDEADMRNSRIGDFLDEGSSSEKMGRKPASAALSSTIFSLIVTVLLCLSRV